MQPLYSIDGGQTWTVLPAGLITQTAPGGDYYGITSTTAPTGVTVNLQGIAGVNNNPNFELQLAAAYDPSLPLITDGNRDPQWREHQRSSRPVRHWNRRAGQCPASDSVWQRRKQPR